MVVSLLFAAVKTWKTCWSSWSVFNVVNLQYPRSPNALSSARHDVKTQSGPRSPGRLQSCMLNLEIFRKKGEAELKTSRYTDQDMKELRTFEDAS